MCLGGMPYDKKKRVWRDRPNPKNIGEKWMKNSPIKTSADIDVDLDIMTISNLPKTCREKH